MEISSFSFLTQEDYPSPNFFSFFQDFDLPATDSATTTAPTDIASHPLPKKRRTDDFDFDQVVEEGSLKTVEDILSKFLGFDNEEEKNNPKLDWSSQQPFANQSVFDFSNQQPGLMMNEKMECSKPLAGNNKRARENSNEFISSPEDSQPPQQRRLWVKDRSKAWWEQCNSPDFPEVEFKKAFRMSRATFDMICEELESVVTKKDTMLRQAIPVRQRVAVCIWRLATGEPLREVSKRFGLGISTCHKLVLEVCTAIRGVLMPKFVQWPNDNKMDEIKQEYQMLSGMPNVGGSIYTTHVPIIAPKVSVAAYFNKRHTERNQKTSYSVTVQGVVDPKGVFTDVCIGWPGSMSDDKVLEKSAFYQRANRGLLKDVWVVGNSGFPLMDWVLAPYTRQNLTWTQHAFNEKVGEVQKVAKEAFMRMKARWSCLQKRTEVKLQDLPVVLGACCVLHNICEMRGEQLNPELRFDLFDDEMVPENIVRSMNAAQARDQIAHKLLHHNHAGTNFL